MSQPPSTTAYGVSGSVGTAAQVVATTKCSVGTSFYNRYGDPYMEVTVKSDTAYTLYVYGSGNSGTPLVSTADGMSAGYLIATIPGKAANGGALTGYGGETMPVRIAGNKQVLPVVYQASGGNAAVTITYKTHS